jgi:hypothetical protein
MNIVQRLPDLIPRLCENVIGNGSMEDNRAILTDRMNDLRNYYNGDAPDDDLYSSQPRLRAAYIYLYMLYGVAAFRYRI